MNTGPARPGPSRARGIALLLALLVTALATVLVAMLFDRGEISLGRTRNLARGAQADQYALGLEAWAVDLLRRDASSGQRIDALDDLWAAPLPPTPVAGGTIQGRMRDLDGAFDLNGLVRNGVPNAPALAQFQRLLGALKLDPGMADAVVDWLDGDFEPGMRGAEDNFYLSATPAYRSANRRFMHASELRQVRGFDAQRYAALAPYICALPAPVRLNVNSASIPVLMSLGPNISRAIAERLARDGHARYATAQEFQDALLQAGGSLDAPDGVGVASEYFVAQAEIELDGIAFSYASLLQRQGLESVVLARMRGRYWQ